MGRKYVKRLATHRKCDIYWLVCFVFGFMLTTILFNIGYPLYRINKSWIDGNSELELYCGKVSIQNATKWQINAYLLEKRLCQNRKKLLIPVKIIFKDTMYVDVINYEDGSSNIHFNDENGVRGKTAIDSQSYAVILMLPTKWPTEILKSGHKVSGDDPDCGYGFMFRDVTDPNIFFSATVEHELVHARDFAQSNDPRQDDMAGECQARLEEKKIINGWFYQPIVRLKK